MRGNTENCDGAGESEENENVIGDKMEEKGCCSCLTSHGRATAMGAKPPQITSASHDVRKQGMASVART